MMNRQQLKIKQQGIVLFIAMVALVVMSLAAVALIRSVDTNTKISGNLAFKQSALTSADRGVESAITWLQAQGIASLNNSIQTKAYFATYGDIDEDGTKDDVVGNLDAQETLKADSTWGAGALAAGTGIVNGVETSSKNTIHYIIERMCELPGPSAKTVTNTCLFRHSESSGSLADRDNTNADLLSQEDLDPLYRITVRVKGPKNTESYTQTYAY